MGDDSASIFLNLIAELKNAAEAQGEKVFAEGLSRCLRTATTNPQCPLARLLFAAFTNSRQTGKPLQPSNRLPPSGFPSGFFDRPPAEVLEDLHTILKLDAGLRGDWGLLSALKKCEGLMAAEFMNLCPVREVLVSAKFPNEHHS